MGRCEGMKGKIVFCTAFSFLFGLMGYFVLLLLGIDQPLLLALMAGLLFALLLFPTFLIIESITDRRYAKFEKNILSPVFHKTGTLIALDKKTVRNGRVYFCEAGIVLISMDEKPYLMEEILLANLQRYDFDNIHLNIRTNDGRVFVLTFPNVKEVMAVLDAHGWLRHD